MESKVGIRRHERGAARSSIVRRTLAVLLVLLGTAAHGGVHIDLDESAEVGHYATYALHEGEPDFSTSDPVAHAGVLEILRTHLDRAGMREVASDPDCWIAYRVIEERHGVVSASRIAGLDGTAPEDGGRRFRTAEMGVLTVSEYSVGTIIVDVFDGVRRRLIWRGSVSGIVGPDSTLGGRQSDKLVRRVVRKWESEYRRQRRRANTRKP